MNLEPIWVIDTNIIVSALWSDKGRPAQLWKACENGRFVLGYNPEILGEYHEVLHRPEFSFLQPAIADTIAVILNYGAVLPTPPITPGVLGLPDPDDEKFLAAALVSPDRILVTGNGRHYPARFRRGVDVITPREALSRLG